MSAIEFEWDSRDLKVFRGGAMEKALARAMRLAGNQALKTLHTGTTDLVLRKKSLSQATVTEDQKAFKPGRSEALKDFTWTLWVRGKPVPMMAFPKVIMMRGARTRAISVGFGPGNRERIGGAFRATMKSGHVGLFKRDPLKKMRGDPKRAAINELFSFRMPKDLGGEVMTTLADPVYRKLKSAFQRGLDREMGKLVRKGDL